MRCPFCAAPATGVVESRVSQEGDSVRRRRVCGKCGKRFTTYERVSGNALWVVKKDGRREPFDREKLRLGILKAIEKRPVSISLVDEVVDEIEREMMRKQSEEVSSRAVGNAVLRHLKKVDSVSYLRFASVYFEFDDLGDFEKIIKEKLEKE